MQTIRKTDLPILLATIWISLSEFVRNTFFITKFLDSALPRFGIDLSGTTYQWCSLGYMVFVLRYCNFYF